uniref:Uncharacterized protein n=1 Tax=Trichogramma kaykai TaxID=54128 RepID=A0ABD2WIB7_9HYME
MDYYHAKSVSQTLVKYLTENDRICLVPFSVWPNFVKYQKIIFSLTLARHIHDTIQNRDGLPSASVAPIALYAAREKKRRPQRRCARLFLPALCHSRLSFTRRISAKFLCICERAQLRCQDPLDYARLSRARQYNIYSNTCGTFTSRCRLNFFVPSLFIFPTNYILRTIRVKKKKYEKKIMQSNLKLEANSRVL